MSSSSLPHASSCGPLWVSSHILLREFSLLNNFFWPEKNNLAHFTDRLAQLLRSPRAIRKVLTEREGAWVSHYT